ncbi:uncharacterized protein LOC111332580 [Stylophora pistillata]|uniref:THAP-type domain-containing protein n=1 Tax=Stylophora pistillata TaxID=50429 RepID=A0A2B4S3V4_STYPI|nr:uncharacterized protein LOC111332580 [Stylophora pistillata]PFX23733.1 hypothetical protein AWC38_SpisGene11693 [Stylophora pistillata]
MPRRENSALPKLNIVPCLIVDCHTRSGRDKEKSFCRVPFVIKHREDEVKELSIERLLNWLSAISGVGLTEDILKNDRACCRHFVSGRPAANWDKYNVHWVPSLHQGHDRKGKTDLELQATWSDRVKTRRKRRHKQALNETAAKVQLLDVDGKMVKVLIFDDSLSDILDETSVGCKQDADFGDLDEVSSQFNKLTLLKDGTSQTESESKDSTTETEEYDYMFENDKQGTFDLKDMRDDDKARFYTYLPSFHVLSCLYEHV